MEPRIEILEVTDHAGERIDAYIAERMPDLSRSAAGRLIDEGLVTVGGAPVKAKYKIKPGDVIRVEVPPPAPAHISAEEIPLEIIYEDSDIIVVNKPRGMTTHPAPGAPAGTLVNALLARTADLSGVGGVQRPGIVHRLDKDTSGLIVVAKNDAAHVNLQAQIQRRTAERKYLALVWGDTKFEKAIVDAPIGRHPVHRQKMAVIAEGGRARAAVTDLTVVERLDGFTLLEASLRTGRTHQIRVHCAYIGHPVVGDPIYGGRRSLPGRFGPLARAEFERLLAALAGQALHAYRLSFDHPRTGERLEFEAPLPHDMQTLIDWIRAHTR
ncbi:MAG: RluA family pseudouridine synthase [Armatimonadetes bacterium]|nr:RluA family pseudouridine synthase [Armatimonadota bacterium]